MGTIKLKSSIKNDNYTKYVYDAFDIQNKEETEVEAVAKETEDRAEA